MAKKIEWSHESIGDVISIAEYIEIDSRYYASEFAREIFEKAESLNEFPKRGRVVPELSVENIRELLFGNYRLIYKIHNNLISVIAILHGSRDIRKILLNRIK